MTITGCLKCGGTHYGSNSCPYTDEEVAAMNAPAVDITNVAVVAKLDEDRNRRQR